MANEGTPSLGGDRTFKTEASPGAEEECERKSPPEVAEGPTISWVSDAGGYSANLTEEGLIEEPTFENTYMHYVHSVALYVPSADAGSWKNKPTEHTVEIVYCPGDTSETATPNASCKPWPEANNCASGDATTPVTFIEAASDPACVVVDDGHCAKAAYAEGARCESLGGVPACVISSEFSGCVRSGKDLFTGIELYETLPCPSTVKGEECHWGQEYWMNKGPSDVFRAKITATNSHGTASAYSTPIYPPL